jgi:hypothetical protein
VFHVSYYWVIGVSCVCNTVQRCEIYSDAITILQIRFLDAFETKGCKNAPISLALCLIGRVEGLKNRWRDFNEIRCWEILQRSVVTVQVWSKSISNNWYFAWKLRALLWAEVTGWENPRLGNPSLGNPRSVLQPRPESTVDVTTSHCVLNGPRPLSYLPSGYWIKTAWVWSCRFLHTLWWHRTSQESGWHSCCGRSWVQFSTQRPAIVTEFFRGFSQCLS